MSLLRCLNVQGIVGIAASLALGILLMFERGEARRWKSESARFEQLYKQEHAAFAGTVANYRAAAQQAEAADEANAKRVAAEQASISERISNDYETRLAAARSLSQRLREGAEAGADPRSGAAAAVPRVPGPAGGAAQNAGEDRLPYCDALTATEQAIQLDELIKWVRQQAAVDPNEEK